MKRVMGAFLALSLVPLPVWAAPAWPKASFRMIGSWKEVGDSGMVLVVTAHELSMQAPHVAPQTVNYAILADSAQRVVIRTLEKDGDVLEVTVFDRSLELHARGEEGSLRFQRMD